LFEEKKGLSFISNRQRQKEGTFSASELAGIEPTPPLFDGIFRCMALYYDFKSDGYLKGSTMNEPESLSSPVAAWPEPDLLAYFWISPSRVPAHEPYRQLSPSVEQPELAWSTQADSPVTVGLLCHSETVTVTLSP
jgi:hypothetical protein